MKKIHKALVFALVSLLMCGSLRAQSAIEFPLSLRQGHYYFTAVVASDSVEIMLDSGIPALLVSEDFYQKHKADFAIDFVDSKANIRLMNDIYPILFKGEGVIAIGCALYDGPVYILGDYEGLVLAVQYLKHPADNSQLIGIDLPGQRLTVMMGSDDRTKGGERYQMKRDKESGFPLLHTKFKINTPDGEATLKGDLVVDFGNPLLLFLNGNHRSLQKAVKKGLQLQDAMNPAGQVVAKGLYANSVQLAGREFGDMSIGVDIHKHNIKQLGYLGVRFFDRPVVLDFVRMQLIIPSTDESAESPATD